MHISFSVKKKRLLDCISDVIVVLKEMKNAITQQDLDITLPFYTTNQVFDEDDTEEMNFQLAYNKFVLEVEYQKVELENNEETILEIQKLSEKVFTKNNMCVVVVGNTRGITKKSIAQIIDNI